MSKGQLHFNEITGRLEKCNAIKGKCPFGEENHFNSFKEAQEYADKKNELKAKAEREIEESGAREIIDQTVQNIRYTERLLLKDNLTTKDLSEAHYNMVIARYNLDRSEDYTAMVDKKYFADPDVRDEAIEELEIERANGAKELDKAYKDINEKFSSHLNSKIKNNDELIKKLKNIDKRQYEKEKSNIIKQAGEMDRNIYITERLETLMDDEENLKHFKEINRKSTDGFNKLAKIIQKFDDSENFKDDELLKAHVRTILRRAEE